MAFIEGIGGPELLLVMFIVLLLFGGEKLPVLAKTIGKTMRELKKASADVERELKKAMEEPETPPSIPHQSPYPMPAAESTPQPALPEPYAQVSDPLLDASRSPEAPPIPPEAKTEPPTSPKS